MKEQSFLVPKDNTLKAGDATHIQFSVTYQKGGVNWGTGQEESGGFYFHVSFCSITEHSTTTTLYGDDSFKCLILPAKRNSQKKQEKLFEHFNTNKLLEKMAEGKQELADEIFAQAKTFK